MSIVGTTNVATEMVFSPVYMKSSSSKTNLLGCSVPNPGLNLAKGTKPAPFLRPEFTSAVSWPQSSGQKLDPESTPCTAVKKNLEVSIVGPTRKRPADASVQTLHKTSSPLKDLLPAKRTLITQKIKSESTTGKKTPPSNSLKANKMVTSGLECKKELFTPGVDAASSANISSSEDFLKRSIADARTEDKLITAVATPADLCYLPNLQFFNAQKMCVSRGPSRCAATNCNSGRIPEPKRDPEADGAVVGQLSFNTIRNDQPNTIKPLFQGSY
ncbi:hypothetical protein GOODEAATRI_020631 [Goodea atripinnis]|uniref:Uncharacterized protein n=1 Tax=Goodea atripinnis TaxID=208336 RepID=A0ABV0MV76_9TELE